MCLADPKADCSSNVSGFPHLFTVYQCGAPILQEYLDKLVLPVVVSSPVMWTFKDERGHRRGGHVEG